MAPARSELRSDPGRCRAGAEGEPPRCRTAGVDLPHALRGRDAELAGPSTRGGRAHEQVREADRAPAGPGRRRGILRFDARLTWLAQVVKRLLDNLRSRDNLKQAFEQETAEVPRR